ncbi:hypothetical protein D9M70_505360 [compost metagenome]
MQRHQLVLIGKRLGEFTGKRRLLELGAEARSHVGRDGNAADAPMGIEAECRRVLAGELNEIRTAGHALFGNALDLAGRILDADDVRIGLAKRRHGLDTHIHDRPAGDVVDDDRQLHAFGDRGIMREEALLRRLVVIGRDNEDRIGTSLFGMLRELDCFRRVVGAGAGDHRHPLGRRLDAELDDFLVLVMGKGRRLAGGADRHETMAAFFYLPFHMRDETIRIHRAGGGERCYESGNGTLEHAQLLTAQRRKMHSCFGRNRRLKNCRTIIM